MYHAIYESKPFSLESHLQSVIDRKKAVEELKKRADKGGYLCPHCNDTLIIRAGEVRDIHFSHSSGKTCLLTEASDTYKKQIKRESKQHSVMREIVHEVLKTQEKIRPDLQVEYGYIAKAQEKWTHFPDIILQNKKQELAISILTNVDRSKDNKLAKQIKKRNLYYKEKGLQTIWFIEEQEMSLDWENHVIHLWESEIDLAVKSEEDAKWDELLSSLGQTDEITDVFGYWRRSNMISKDSRSLYYVYSTQEGIDFSVHRFIIDEKQFPYRAFALSKGYRMNISTALSFNEQLALSDSKQELLDRQWFMEEYHKRKEEKTHHEEVKYQEQPTITANTVRSFSYTSTEKSENMQPPSAYIPPNMSYGDLTSKLKQKLGMTQQEQMRLWHSYVLKHGIKQLNQIWMLAEEVDSFQELEHSIKQNLL